MDYIAALHALKAGKTVYRSSWKVKGFVRAETALVYHDADGWIDVGWKADHDDMNAWDWVEGIPEENADTATSSGSTDAPEADGVCRGPAMPDIEDIIDEISMSLLDLKIALLQWQINAKGQSCCKDLLNACTVKGWSTGQKEEKE